jgi:hypothetical protein
LPEFTALPSLCDVYFRQPGQGKAMAFMPEDDAMFRLGQRVFKDGKRQSIEAISIRVCRHGRGNI